MALRVTGAERVLRTLQKFDERGDGTLDCEMLQQVFCALSSNIQVSEHFRDLLQSRQVAGRIDYENFIVWLWGDVDSDDDVDEHVLRVERLVAALMSMDACGSGFVDIERLRCVINSQPDLLVPLCQEEFARHVERSASRSGGIVRYRKFVHWFFNRSCDLRRAVAWHSLHDATGSGSVDSLKAAIVRGEVAGLVSADLAQAKSILELQERKETAAVDLRDVMEGIDVNAMRAFREILQRRWQGAERPKPDCKDTARKYLLHSCSHRVASTLDRVVRQGVAAEVTGDVLSAASAALVEARAEALCGQVWKAAQEEPRFDLSGALKHQTIRHQNMCNHVDGRRRL